MPKGLIYAVAAMLVLALAPLPYAYYQILRFVVCGTFAYLAYMAVQKEHHGHTAIFSVLAVLFNPIVPIHLDRTLWAFIDVGSAGLLLWSSNNYGQKSAKDPGPHS